MAPEEGRNVRNKLISKTLAVIFMIKILVSSQLYRLPKVEELLSQLSLIGPLAIGHKLSRNGISAS